MTRKALTKFPCQKKNGKQFFMEFPLKALLSVINWLSPQKKKKKIHAFLSCTIEDLHVLLTV